MEDRPSFRDKEEPVYSNKTMVTENHGKSKGKDAIVAVFPKKIWSKRRKGLDIMAEIILHSTHPDYCKECVYYDSHDQCCRSKDYERNFAKVNFVRKYCKYKRRRKMKGEAGSE